MVECRVWVDDDMVERRCVLEVDGHVVEDMFSRVAAGSYSTWRRVLRCWEMMM